MDRLTRAVQFDENRFGGRFHRLRLYAETSQGQIICVGEFGRNCRNQRLVSNVHPPDRDNPNPAPRYKLVVIGGDTTGLATAAGGAGLGVVLPDGKLLVFPQRNPQSRTLKAFSPECDRFQPTVALIAESSD